jgi:integrase/recombinase XerD
LANLSIEDIDLTQRKARVKGKGKKIRHIHFSQECALVLKEYLQTRKGDGTGALFMGRFGIPLQGGGIYKIIKELGEKETSVNEMGQLLTKIKQTITELAAH